MKDDLLGPPSDFGWQQCHGCEAGDDRGVQNHKPDCPGGCVRPQCSYHAT